MKNKKAILQTLFLLFLIVGTVMIVKQNASMPYVKTKGGCSAHIIMQHIRPSATCSS